MSGIDGRSSPSPDRKGLLTSAHEAPKTISNSTIKAYGKLAKFAAKIGDWAAPRDSATASSTESHSSMNLSKVLTGFGKLCALPSDLSCAAKGFNESESFSVVGMTASAASLASSLITADDMLGGALGVKNEDNINAMLFLLIPSVVDGAVSFYKDSRLTAQLASEIEKHMPDMDRPLTFGSVDKMLGALFATEESVKQRCAREPNPYRRRKLKKAEEERMRSAKELAPLLKKAVGEQRFTFLQTIYQNWSGQKFSKLCKKYAETKGSSIKKAKQELLHALTNDVLNIQAACEKRVDWLNLADLAKDAFTVSGLGRIIPSTVSCHKVAMDLISGLTGLRSLGWY